MQIFEDFRNSKGILSKDESVLRVRMYQPLFQMNTKNFTLPKVRKEMAANF
jgi:hypothetical protein